MSLKEYSFDLSERFRELVIERYHTIPNEWHIYRDHYGILSSPRDGYHMCKTGYFPSYYPAEFYEFSLLHGRFPLMYRGGFEIMVGLPYWYEETFYCFESV